MLSRIYNSIIWNNLATAGSYNGLLVRGGTFVVQNSLVQDSGGSAAWKSDIGTDGGGNIDVDPQFIQPINPNAAPTTAGDFRVALRSPAVDTGSNAGLATITPPVTTDLIGNPRIFNNIVDMSAYEMPMTCPPNGTTRLYVNEFAVGTGSGLDWTNALPDLQNALTLARDCGGIGEVWVASGVYYPDEGALQANGDRAAAFQVQSGLAIYGGFRGTESALSQRDPWSYITVLSGDIDQNDKTDAHDLVETPADIVGANSYHVVLASGTDSSARLDGFAVTGGQANGSPTNRQHEGGGLFADVGSPTLNNLVFVGNIGVEGGAMTLVNGSNAAISNAWFGGNAASDYGGALHSESSNPTLVNVQMSGNRAAAGGGALYNLASNPDLVNVTIAGNAAGGTVARAGDSPLAPEIAPTGGGILNLTGSKPALRNSIIGANEDSTGVGTPSSSIRNLDVGSTPSADYSDIQGLASISGLIFDATSIDADPLFTGIINPSKAPDFTQALKLRHGSPAINVGNNSFNSQPLDLGQQPRIQDSIIDMGAFEAKPAPHVAVHKHVSTPTARIGETVTYTYEVVNTGTITLTALSGADDKLGALNFGVSELAPGAVAVTSLAYTIVAGDLPGPLANLVTVNATSALSGTVVATDTATVSISNRPDVELKATAHPNTAKEGAQVTFDYVVTNIGDVPLQGITASDTILGTITLSSTSLAPGASATGSGSYTVLHSDLPGPLTNKATAAGASPTGKQVAATVTTSVALEAKPTPPIPPVGPTTLYLPVVQK